MRKKKEEVEFLPTGAKAEGPGFGMQHFFGHLKGCSKKKMRKISHCYNQPILQGFFYCESECITSGRVHVPLQQCHDLDFA